MSQNMNQYTSSNIQPWSSHCGSAETNLTSVHEVRSLAQLRRLRILHCHEQWCWSPMWLRSCVVVAVVQAGSHSSNLTPSLGTSSICHECSTTPPKKDIAEIYDKECSAYVFMVFVLTLRSLIHVDFKIFIFSTVLNSQCSINFCCTAK